MEMVMTLTNNGVRMYGIAHVPDQPADGFKHKLGVVILHAGRQARRGPHRLYVKVARALCQAGLHVFRYDGTGYGDSEGSETQTFEEWLSDASCALRSFSQTFGLDRMILWGLCSGAMLAIHSAAREPARIDSLILCNLIFNPDRLQPNRPFRAGYRRLVPFLLGLKAVVTSPVPYIRASAAKAKRLLRRSFRPTPIDQRFEAVIIKHMKSLPHAFSMAAKPTLFIFGTADPVAGTFREELFGNNVWRKHLSGIVTESVVIEGADHNFSSLEHEKSVIGTTVRWAMRRAISGDRVASKADGAPFGVRP